MARCAIITGVGLVTSLGLNVDEVWHQVRRGACGVRRLTAIEPSVDAQADGGQALDLPVDYWPHLPREARYIRWTVEAAMKSARLDSIGDRTRIAVVLGTTLHGMPSAGRFLRSRDYGDFSSFLAGDTAALALHDLLPRGLRVTTCSACSSSLGAVALGQTLLAEGYADVVVAGGYDPISEYTWAGFNALKLISDEPLRPFAKGRKGMKIGEGYGMVVIERPGESAKRGHKPLAEIAGWGESSDAFHLTRPRPDGAGAISAMRDAIRWSGIEPGDLDAAVAHATGTPENDAAEAAALKGLLGEKLASTPVTALKSHFGHTLGGAGAVELVMGVRILTEGVVPPCANLRSGETEFEGLDVVCGSERRKTIRHLICTSLGFGGANTSVVIRHPESQRSFPVPRPTGIQAVISGVGVVVPGAVGNGLFVEMVKSKRRESESGCTIPDCEFEKLLSWQRARRLNGYVKLSLCAATLAVRDAGLAEASDMLGAASAIFATTHTSPGYCYEYYERIVREGAASANPMLFAEGVPNAASAHASLMFGLKGGCQTLIGTRTVGVDALAIAGMRVRSGVSERVMVVAAEENHQLLDEAYAACRPNKSSQATRVCSCAVGFVVETSEAVRLRGGRVYAALGAGRCISGDRMPLRELLNSVTGGRQVKILARPPVKLGGQAASVEPLLALAGSLLGGEDEGARALVAMDRRDDSLDGGVASVLMVEDWIDDRSDGWTIHTMR